MRYNIPWCEHMIEINVTTNRHLLSVAASPSRKLGRKEKGKIETRQRVKATGTSENFVGQRQAMRSILNREDPHHGNDKLATIIRRRWCIHNIDLMDRPWNNSVYHFFALVYSSRKVRDPTEAIRHAPTICLQLRILRRRRRSVDGIKRLIIYDYNSKSSLGTSLEDRINAEKNHKQEIILVLPEKGNL